MLELGSESQLSLLKRRGQQPGAHTERVMLKGVTGEDDKHGASLKTEGRKRNVPLPDPRGFTVLDLPFHSREEFIGVITKIKESQAFKWP